MKRPAAAKAKGKSGKGAKKLKMASPVGPGNPEEELQDVASSGEEKVEPEAAAASGLTKTDTKKRKTSANPENEGEIFKAKEADTNRAYSGPGARKTFAGRRPPKTTQAHHRFCAMSRVFKEVIAPRLLPETPPSSVEAWGYMWTQLNCNQMLFFTGLVFWASSEGLVVELWIQQAAQPECQ